VHAAIDDLELNSEEPRQGNVSNRLCPTHGLHYNPLISESCARCAEERQQERQARLALLIVALVLLAIVTVIVQVTWLYYSNPETTASGKAALETALALFPH